MIGITLSSERIRTAPAEVQRWIEHEVMTSLGQQALSADGGKPHDEHLATCSAEEVAEILSQVQGVLPAVNVFFELGRQGAIVGQPNIQGFRLIDIAHHTRLQNVGQVIACLDIISQAFSRASGDATAQFCGFDREGRCFITRETQQSIRQLWQKVIANQQLGLDGQEDLTLASEPAGKQGGAVNPDAEANTARPRQEASGRGDSAVA